MTYRNWLPSGFWFVNFQIGTQQKPQDTTGTYLKIISGLLQNHAKLSITLHILLSKKWIKLFYGSLHRYFPTVECKLRSFKWLSSNTYTNIADQAHSLVFCLDKRYIYSLIHTQMGKVLFCKLEYTEIRVLLTKHALLDPIQEHLWLMKAKTPQCRTRDKQLSTLSLANFGLPVNIYRCSLETFATEVVNLFTIDR